MQYDSHQVKNYRHCIWKWCGVEGCVIDRQKHLSRIFSELIKKNSIYARGFMGRYLSGILLEK